MADFPITEAQITGLFVEGVLYGGYLVSLGYCIHALVATPTRWRRLDELNWPMIVVAAVMGAIATFDLALGFYHNLKAFVFSSIPAAEEFDNISDWVNIMKTVTVLLQTMIGDSMLIYRCWIVYSRRFVVVAFALAMWLATLACAIVVTFYEATLHSQVLVNAKKLSPFITAFWALSIALNITTTGLLVWKIWKVATESAAYKYRTSDLPARRNLRLVMQNIIESGLLYTTVAFITFVTYVAGSNAAYVVSDAEVQVVGIAFNLIIIRASHRLSEEQAVDKSMHTGHSHQLNFISQRASTAPGGQRSQLHVVVTQDVSRDSFSPQKGKPEAGYENEDGKTLAV